MWYIIILGFILVVFLVYRFSDKIEKHFPWLWKNIGQPIFNYFFVISVRKVTMRYITAMAGFNIALPVIQFVIDKEHNFKAAINFGGSSLDWAAVAISAILTIGYGIYISYENKSLKSVDVNTIEDVVEAVQTQVGRGSLEIIKNTLPQIKHCLGTLHVNTAYGLLETMRAEVDSARMPDWSLLSRIDYLMGVCKRHTDGDKCRSHLVKAYDEMEKAGGYDKEIVAGRIYVACKQKDDTLAKELAYELKERDSENIWCWIPGMFFCQDIRQEKKSLPEKIKDEYKLYAELLSLGRNDIMEAIDALNLSIPELREMTLDNFVLWPFWLSAALTQFVSKWRLGADGGCQETEDSERMLKLTDRYFELLHQTELPDLMPDIKFIHTFVSYNHDHCPKRIEEIAEAKPSNALKELYYLVYASMLQSEKKYQEALDLLASYDGEKSISIQHDRLQMAVMYDNITEIKAVFKKVVDDELTIPTSMMGNFCASLHICADQLAESVGQLKFENDVLKRLFQELFNFKMGNEVDIDYIVEHMHDMPQEMIAYMATLLQKYGRTDDAIDLLEPVLSDKYFDYRNYAYIGLLQSDNKYNSKLYGYLGTLREKGLATDDLLNIELQMSERMMDFERSLIISTLLMERHPESGIMVEHHLMALYRNGRNDEIEVMFDGLKDLQFPITSVQNIFNIYLITGFYEKALAFLYNEIQKNNDQTLRDFFFQVHLHKEIEKIVMKQYDVVSIDSFVLIETDGKEEYTAIRQGSYLEELLGKKPGDEISYNAVNREIKIKVLAIFNRYFKLMKEISDEIAKNQSKHIRSFTIQDLEGGEGILANLEKIAGPRKEYKDEERKMKELYKVGRTTLYYFINQERLFSDLYGLIFGDFKVYMIPIQIVNHLMQVSEIDVKKMKPVLDLSSMLLLHEMQKKFGWEYPTKFIVSRSLQVAIHDAAVKERNAIPSFLTDEILSYITIETTGQDEHPMLSKLIMLSRWIEDYCEVEVDEELLNEELNKMPNDLSILYMQSVRLANKPDRLLITEDWTATQINYKAYCALSTGNWLSLMGIGDNKEVNRYLASINYIGCGLSGDYILEQYNAKRAKQKNNFSTCLENIEANPFNATESFHAGNLMLSGIVTPSDHMVVSSMFASAFKNMEYKQAANILNLAMRMYSNKEYQQCLMEGFKMAHPVIL